MKEHTVDVSRLDEFVACFAIVNYCIAAAYDRRTRFKLMFRVGSKESCPLIHTNFKTVKDFVKSHLHRFTKADMVDNVVTVWVKAHRSTQHETNSNLLS